MNGRLYFISDKDKQAKNLNTNSVSTQRSSFSAPQATENLSTKRVKWNSVLKQGNAAKSLRSRDVVLDDPDQEFVECEQQGTHFIADGVRVDVEATEDNDIDEDPGEQEMEELDYDEQDLEDGECPQDQEECPGGLPLGPPTDRPERMRYVGAPIDTVQPILLTQREDDEITFNFRDENVEQAKQAEANQLLADNPHLGSIFQEMIQKGVREEVKRQMGEQTPKQGNTITRDITKRGNDRSLNQPGPGVTKSPSDTTIYAPAVHRLNDGPLGISAETAMDKISDFIEGIRLETQHRVTPARGTPVRKAPTPGMSKEGVPQPDKRIVVNEVELEAVKQQIEEAEQYSAMVEPPPKGNKAQFDINLVKRAEADDHNDDNYFHLTCHVDKSLKSKIEQGEYIDLERLIPKRKTRGGIDDSRLEWVTRDGMTYLAPAQDKECQINGIRKWEQAFRIYAAIYCNANPTRSGEIWQYIHTINSAATSFQWENVQYYDTVFRQMMSDKPGRSWSKTYVQLWQLALRDPIHKNQSGSSGGRVANESATTSGKNNQKNWRERCCWQFNRTGKCAKENCPFDRRCSYCGMWNSHGSNTCRKRLGGDKEAPSSCSNAPAAQSGKN